MRLNITPRFIVAIVTAAVLPLLAYGLLAISTLRTGTRRSVAEGNQNVARGAAQQIDQYMLLNVKILESLAADLRHTSLQAWQQDRILKDYALDFPEFRELAVFAADGTMSATSRVGATSLRTPEATPLPAEPTVAAVTVDDDLLPSTTVTIPLSRLGRADGWLVGELNLEELWRMVDRIRVGTEGFALLVARDGRLIAHGNPDAKTRVAAGENLADHQLVKSAWANYDLQHPPRTVPVPRRPRSRLSSSGLTRSLEYEDEGGRSMLGAAAPIAWLGWTVVVEQPTREAFALAQQLGLNLVIAIVVVLVFTVTLGAYWGRSFIRPIYTLIRGTKAIASGNLGERVSIGGHDELAQLGAAFNGMADRLVELQDDVRKQERQAMFGRIAAGLVHDISHPIQNIRNNCNLILKLGDDPEYRQTFRRTVDREFTSIRRVLDDLRNLARPMPLERFPVDINRVLTDTVESMTSLAKTAGLTLDRGLSADPIYVEGDTFALGRVYRNLIVNAIEATPPGGSVRARATVATGRARVVVEDTGAGIPADRLGAIFEDFKTTKRRGLGLGLAISRKIVEQLGGTITVTSHVGAGTSFVVEFPTTDKRPFGREPVDHGPGSAG